MATASLHERHREVQDWLEEVFGDKPVPQYEINQRTVEILHQLMRTNLKQDEDVSLVIDDLKLKAQEYSVEAGRLNGVLRQVGLTPGVLSHSGTVSLRTLASVAILLDTKDAAMTNLLLSLGELCQAPFAVEDARRTELRLSSQLTSKTKAALLRANTLTKALEGVEETASYQALNLDKKAKQVGFLQTKSQQYRKEIQQLQGELKAQGADPNVYHSALLHREEELKKLRDRLHPMKAKLDSYMRLPPNLPLAKVKVEEVKREMAAMEEELCQHINMFHV